MLESMVYRIFMFLAFSFQAGAGKPRKYELWVSYPNIIFLCFSPHGTELVGASMTCDLTAV